LNLEQKWLTVDFRPAQNCGSPARASMVEVKEEFFFASVLDRNIPETIMKLDPYCLMRQKRGHITKSVVLFHPHQRGTAGLPTRFCAG